MFFNKKKYEKEKEVIPPTPTQHEILTISCDVSYCCNVWDDNAKQYFYCNTGTLTFTVKHTSTDSCNSILDLVKFHIKQKVGNNLNNKMLIDYNDPWLLNYTRGRFNIVDGIPNKFIPYKQVFNTTYEEFLNVYPIFCFDKMYPLFYALDVNCLRDIEKSFYDKFLITSYSPSIDNIIKHLFDNIEINIKSITEELSLQQIQFLCKDKKHIIGYN